MFITSFIGLPNAPLVHISDKQVKKMQRRSLNNRSMTEISDEHLGGTVSSQTSSSSLTSQAAPKSLLTRSFHSLMHHGQHQQQQYHHQHQHQHQHHEPSNQSSSGGRRRPSFLLGGHHHHQHHDDQLHQPQSDDLYRHGGKRRVLVRRLSPLIA